MPASAAAPPCPASAPSDSQAIAAAAACQGKVEIADRRAETVRVFANPDGTTVSETYAYPQWVRKPDGSWADLDPTLVTNADGSLSPKASLIDTTLSGGGSGPLITARRAGKELGYRWGGVLPKPVVERNTATYKEVLSGVDLVVTATDIGFSQVFVVKTREAAKNPAVRKLRLDSSLKGLRWVTDETAVQAVDDQGVAVMTATAPRMWDSGRQSPLNEALIGESGAPRKDSTVRGPADGARSAALALNVQGSVLAFTPDSSILDAPETQFPVFLDPDLGAGRKWSMINNQFPNQSYWSYDTTDCPDDPNTGQPYQTDCAKVGRAVGYTMVYRSMFEFPAASFMGRDIISVQFSIDLLHSQNCQPYNWTHVVWVNGYLGAHNTWNQLETSWQRGGGAGGYHVSAYNNTYTCGRVRVPSEFAGDGLFNHVVRTAGEPYGYITLGLKAEEENCSCDWKKFDAKTAKLTVVSNLKPNKPDTMTIDNKTCVAGSGRSFVPTITPTAKARLTDPDGHQMQAKFDYARITNGGTYSTGGSVTKPLVDSGSLPTQVLPAGVIDEGDTFVATGDWTMDGIPDVLSRDTHGTLHVLPGGPTPAATRKLLSRAQVGSSGWSNYTVAGVADWDNNGQPDIIARDTSGQLWMYPRNASGGHGTRVAMSTGWNGLTFFGVAKMDGDAYFDIVASDGNTLWLYPGTGTPTGMDPRVSIGTGWSADYIPVGLADWNHDGTTDIIARYNPTTHLYLYLGSGTRAIYPGNPFRYEIGHGWSGHQALILPDFNGDTHTDILAKQPGVTDWWQYPGSGNNGYGGERRIIASNGVSDGKFAWRVTGGDAYKWGDPSDWCEFEVDTVKPSSPTVNADVYKAASVGCPTPGNPCGAVGKTGRFTFTSSSDTASFKWGWSDPPSNTLTPGAVGGSVYIDWTPTVGGPRTLYVQAYDRAGNFSTVKTHQFEVKVATPALARWKLSDEPGSTSLADDTGNGRTATISGGTLGVPGRINHLTQSAMKFDGTASASTTAAVLDDTSRSFSVAGWAKLDDKDATATVISQGGTNTSAFALQYDKAEDAWKFTATSADVAAPTYLSAKATTPPKVGAWTHLTGTYDSTARHLRIYVNGVLEGDKYGVITWDANGTTRIGGASPTRWRGDLSTVQVWDRAISFDEVRLLADPLEHSTASKVGHWDFTYGEDPTRDSSGYLHHMNFEGGAHVPMENHLRLDGVDDFVYANNPVLRTDQSFTVSARVWLNAGASLSSPYTAVSQDGQAVSGFYLGTRVHGGTPRWSFTFKETDSASGAVWSHAYSPTPVTAADQGRWVQLQGIYEAETGAMRLYVDGVLVSTGTRAGTPWDAAGPFVVGRGLYTAPGGEPDLTDWWPGDVDEVRAYQGIVRTNIALNRPATSDSSCNANETAAKAFDGTWTGNTAKWCSTGTSKWLQVDLGTPRLVREFTLLHARSGGEDLGLNTRDYTIQVSLDGTAWTTAATVAGNAADVTHHYVTPTTARHVRLNVTAAEQSASNAARIYEFQVIQ